LPGDGGDAVSLRTPLGRVLGKGSAGDGVGHWWVQRVTAVALLPLTAWFASALLGRQLQSYEAMRGWLSQPWVAVFAALLVVTVAWHSKLGVEVVIEDYVHGKAGKTSLLLLSTFVHVAAAAAGLFAILRLSLG
jgi:succinate dehydrogenase / fumarate reductase membrane anchor subunit